MKLNKIILISLFVIIFSIVPVSADSSNNGIAYFYDDYFSSEYYEESNDITTRRASGNLYITAYYQNDYTDIMQTSGNPINIAGCALTSVTMASNFLTFKDRNPSQVNQILGPSAAPLNWYEAADKLDMVVYSYQDTETEFSYAYIESQVQFNINGGRPLIIGMILSDGGPHYVLVKGYNTALNKVYINDPSRNLNNTTLEEYRSEGAEFNQIIVYDAE